MVTPAFIMQGGWIIYIILALIFVGDIESDYIGILWLYAAIFSYGLGSLVSAGISSKLPTKQSTRTWHVSYRKTKIILIITLSFFFMLSFIKVFNSGIAINAFINLENLFEINAENAHQRYFEENNMDLVERIELQIYTILSYFLPFMSGLFLVLAKNKKDKIISYLTFIPLVQSLLISNAKLGLIIGVFFFICGIFTTNLLLYGKVPNIKVRNLFKTSIVVILFFLLLFTAMVLRAGSYDSAMISYLKLKFINYMFGSVFAFDYWFVNSQLNTYLFGARTFNAVSNTLGILEREQGVYDEIFKVSFLYTNVYTAFRGIIEDFGKFGGLVFMYLGGFIGGISYKNILNKHPSPLNYVVLSASYFFIFYSFILSPWAYTSLIAVFVLMYFLLIIIKE